MPQRQEQSWQVPGHLETRAGRLEVEGVDAVLLVEQHGSPLYVFSEKRIANNIRDLRSAVEAVHPRVKICYASKANSNMAVLDAVRRAGGDVEVNSGGELFKAKTIGFRPDQIVFNGVSKTDEEIRDAIEYGILAINIDSLYELEQTTRVARSPNLSCGPTFRACRSSGSTTRKPRGSITSARLHIPAVRRCSSSTAA